MTVLRTWRRRLVVTATVALAFVILHQAQTIDSRYAARQATLQDVGALPSPGARLRFSATAYCKGAVTASGVAPRTGVAAADPSLLPVGSVIRVDTDTAHGGIYTIMDTGPAVQGRQIDIYMWSCHEALRFGRRAIDLMVLRLGWNPKASPASLMDSLLLRKGAPDPAPLPARPLRVPPDAILPR